MFEKYGEMHLLIVPNDEHSLMLNLPVVASNGISWVRSIARGETEKDRPKFTHHWDNSTGEITVRLLNEDIRPVKVQLRWTQTYSTIRRDFRYFRHELPDEPCQFRLWPFHERTAPEIRLPNKILHIGPPGPGADCMSYKWWKMQGLAESADEPGTWRAMPPIPDDGHWIGYYIELFFPGGEGAMSWLYKD
jgi:hypothetical protein